MTVRPATTERSPTTRQTTCEIGDVLERLRSTQPELFRSWFRNLRLTSMTGGRFEIAAQNDAQVRYLEAHCRSAFTETAQAVTGRLVSVSFKENTNEDKAKEPEDETGNPVGLGFRATLDPNFTLDRFAVAPGNQLAHSAAIAVAERPGEMYNPLFVYGDGGLGKTHLLQGVVHATGARHGNRSAAFVPCQTFIGDAIRALENDRTDELREQYGSLLLLALDDFHLLADRERSQEVFFHVLNLLLEGKGQLVVSADRLPSELPGLPERLVNRLSAGLVVGVEAPDLETRLAIVRDKAKFLGIDLPPAVARLVAEHREGNVRQLVEAVVRIDSLSNFECGPITIELAERALEPGPAAQAGRKK